jgi:NAD(P)-dependent dehydrogenase (short-subunit alcohol dehydrogenase family)
VATAGFVANEKARTQAGDPTVSDYRRGIPLGRAAKPADIAAAVVYLASDAAAMVTGVTLPVDGGTLRSMQGERSVELTAQPGRVEDQEDSWHALT